jgi:hypothetical protein
VNGIIGFLQQHRNGATQDEISDALRELTVKVVEESKAGKIVIEIGIKPLARGDGLETSVSIVSKPPKETPGVSIFFPSPSGDLQRADPRQATMELREIGPAAAHKGMA